MDARRPRTRRRSHGNGSTRDAREPAGAARLAGKGAKQPRQPARASKTWLRLPIILPLAAIIVVAAYTQWPRAGQRDAGKPAEPGDTARPHSPQPAPASQAAKPNQPDVPEPTVVLEPGQAPGIAFKDLVYEFGLVRSGTEVAHDFVFTNTGTGPLEILLVKPS